MRSQITVKPNTLKMVPAYAKNTFGFDAVNFGFMGLGLGYVENYDLLEDPKGKLGRLRI